MSKKWCRECCVCGARKGPITRTKGRLQRYNVGTPFERIDLDILGHFPVTTKGNRSADHEVTGFTPADILFGRTLQLPCDILFGRPSNTPSLQNENLNNLKARLESVHVFARERIKMASERMKTRYDSGVTGHFKEEDEVWMYNPKRRRGPSPKLEQNCEPYTIVKKLNDVGEQCYEHEKSLPSNVSLMGGKRVLQG
ncbi:hypothetical protein AVEN_222764-1 [Araneus ventricosus]|uniref:Uncharacterized protein n=1 Tax=Araneus ventricosus TaxID=182803 RepID=A0A4Y2AYY1_ARAVE|nr:hypothetical protein AVEN_222764-1 [Araneus ventricosus]